MQETCYCGRIGRIEDRDPVEGEMGMGALRCPKCGHIERLLWLPEEQRMRVIGEARRRVFMEEYGLAETA